MQPSPVLSWDLTLEARALAPSPHTPGWVSRQASQTGECWSALILCAGISLLCPLHPHCCALLRGSEAPPSATRSLCPRRGFLVCGNLSSFTASFQRCRSRPYSFVCFFFFLFSFALPRYVGSFLPFGKSEVFYQRSVGVLFHL